MPPKSLAALHFAAKQASHEAERIAKLRRQKLVDLETYAAAAIAEVKAVHAWNKAMEET